MRYPKFLEKNGRVGFIAPSFGCSTEPYISLYERAKKEFFGKEYRIVEGPNVHTDCGIGKSNTPQECAKEVNDFFINDRCDAIISCGGGETMCEDLPFIDFEGIAKAEPKWFMGYSDNTNLTFTLPVLCDTAAIYGPCASTFGAVPLHSSLTDAFDVMCGKKDSVSNYDKWEIESSRDDENPLAGYNVTEPFKLRSFIGSREITSDSEDIRFSGRLIGGCLDCLVNMAGTEFARVSEFADKYAEDGIIWFLEACELNVMSIKRALWLLNQNGWFKNVKGFLIGRPMLYNDAWGDFGHIESAMSILGQFNVPVILDLDIGHLPPMMPIVSGACADVGVVGNSFEMKYRFE